jgi:hypothetical protein
LDAKAIADALALRFVGATTSAGETFTSTPTASLPNAVSKGPVCLVYHPTGVLEIGVSRMRRDELDYPVKILIDPLDVPSRSDTLYRWYNATRDLVEANIDLDLAYVSWARLVEMRMKIDGEQYMGGAVFDVVEYIVRVHVEEVVTTVST